jgi:hypothetical protein
VGDHLSSAVTMLHPSAHMPSHRLTSGLRDAVAYMSIPACPDAADVQGLTSLTQLTHLDLGWARGVVALAPRLPALQSLALRLQYPDYSVRAPVLAL